MNIINSIHKYKLANRTWNQRNVNTIAKIVVHHTASRQSNTSDDAMLKAEANHHINVNGWPGLSYHFMILPNGNVHQLNNYSDVTWTDGTNYDCVAICLQGYFHPDINESPTPAQLKTLKELLDNLCTQHPEFPADHNDVYGHRERSQTACPGDNLFPKVKEYRDKLGKVDWGTTPAPTPPSDELEKLKKENADLKEQVIRMQADLVTLQNKIDKARADLS